MITEDQLAFLMSLAQKHNITICQEMEKKRYVLRGRGSKIAQFLIASIKNALLKDIICLIIARKQRKVNGFCKAARNKLQKKHPRPSC